MWNFGYHLARAWGAIIRRRYLARLPRTVAGGGINVDRPLDLDVFAYSGEAALPEQAASIRSFLRHVGRPHSFNVVSDGTYSTQSKALLCALDSSVRFHAAAPAPPEHFGASFREYLRQHPTGKQLSLIMSLPHGRPALYMDSDVLFFASADSMIELFAHSAGASAFYLEDCQFSGDARLIESTQEEANPVNTGVLLLFDSLDWSSSVARFERLGRSAPTFFTNQTLTHFAMHANSARAFDPQKFVLQLDDQLIFPDRYAGPGIALRHYVNPVRHKFWTSLARAS